MVEDYTYTKYNVLVRDEHRVEERELNENIEEILKLENAIEIMGGELEEAREKKKRWKIFTNPFLQCAFSIGVVGLEIFAISKGLIFFKNISTLLHQLVLAGVISFAGVPTLFTLFKVRQKINMLYREGEYKEKYLTRKISSKKEELERLERQKSKDMVVSSERNVHSLKSYNEEYLERTIERMRLIRELAIKRELYRIPRIGSYSKIPTSLSREDIVECEDIVGEVVDDYDYQFRKHYNRRHR